MIPARIRSLFHRRAPVDTHAIEALLEQRLAQRRAHRAARQEAARKREAAKVREQFARDPIVQAMVEF